MSDMKFGKYEMYQYIKDNIGRFRGSGDAYNRVCDAISEGVRIYYGYHMKEIRDVGFDQGDLISSVQERLIDDDYRRLRNFVNAFEKDRVAYRSRNNAFKKLLESVLLNEFGKDAPKLKRMRADESELIFGADDIFLFIENNLANIAEHAVYGKIDGVIDHDCSILLADTDLSFEAKKAVTEKTKTKFYKNIVRMIYESKEACTEKAVERNRNNWLFKVTANVYQDLFKKHVRTDGKNVSVESDEEWDALAANCAFESQSPLEKMIRKEEAGDAIEELNNAFRTLILREKDVAALMAFMIDKIDTMNLRDRKNGNPKMLAGRLNGKTLYYIFNNFLTTAEESHLHIYRETLDMLYDRLKIPDGDQTVGDIVFEKKVKAISDYNSRLTKKLKESKDEIIGNYTKGDNQK